MYDNIAYVLIHSPLVGPLTWRLVYQEMTGRGIKAITPILTDHPHSEKPFWKQHAESIARSLSLAAETSNLVLVGHSGAGPILPVIRQFLNHPIEAYIFVDAGIPRDGLSRLDLMKTEDPEWAEQFEQALLRGEHYPTWSTDDLQDVIPDEDLREKLVADIRPRSIAFFSEPIPVFEEWPDAPCAYIKFSAAYNRVSERVKEAGWPVQELNAGHFHMLVNPIMVTDMLIEAIKEL
jgi:hypothetical protein